MRTPVPIIPFLALCILLLGGCDTKEGTRPSPDPVSPGRFEETGEDFLIGALQELHSIAEWAESRPLPPSAPGGKRLLLKTATDTVYVYGQVIAGGYGAVVTERRAYPKGILLITVRKSYGKGGGRIVTDTKRYISYENLRDDEPQQSSFTEMYGLSADTIVTHVLRNGVLETYTFRLPVITRTVNPSDGSVRITTRYASEGKIVSEVTDGAGALVYLRKSYGLSSGALVTRTEYPDSSWRNTLTLGQADGTVFKEITSGP
ncbi:MAG: hypothetical protein WB626_08505 [Bacteroidota bacterium]